ncbi:GntR family transcriptional regulator [Hydrogenispora ethanolica]|uniref:GntR family transcriptional regulator n=1 Tax=Hydrogenispora ethanolica TaxID=1082276 RepID=A0A4R1SBQ4_HYDET|nr:FCD domain-containing protein [Hydrogenispora ethanolica]TCL76849.1 GntR family transcriptional regulator [Hydrogenispora ethanolica]
MEINPINAKRNYQSIIEQFIQLIKTGQIRVGDKLPPERTLAELFNVSRASLREAFSAMEIIGLIEVRPGEGSFVTDLNIAPFINAIAPLFIDNRHMEDELLDLRRLLELEAVALAARAAAPDLAPLDAQLEAMAEAIARNDSKAGAEADIAFHKGIFALTGHTILIKAAECISSILEVSVQFNRSKILMDAANARVLYEQHQQIYQAILSRQPEAAQELMRKHLHLVKEMS